MSMIILILATTLSGIKKSWKSESQEYGGWPKLKKPRTEKVNFSFGQLTVDVYFWKHLETLNIDWCQSNFYRFEGFEQGLNTFHVGPSKGVLNQRSVLQLIPHACQICDRITLKVEGFWTDW